MAFNPANGRAILLPRWVIEDLLRGTHDDDPDVRDAQDTAKAALRGASRNQGGAP